MSAEIKSGESQKKNSPSRRHGITQFAAAAGQRVALAGEGLPFAGQDQLCTAPAVSREVIWMPVPHPLPWHSPLVPGAVASGELEVIARGAVTVGTKGD